MIVAFSAGQMYAAGRRRSPRWKFRIALIQVDNENRIDETDRSAPETGIPATTMPKCPREAEVGVRAETRRVSLHNLFKGGNRKMNKRTRTLVLCILTVSYRIAAAGAQQRTTAPAPAAGTAPQSSGAGAATIGVCDLKTPKAPCIDQPFKGANSIQGLGTKGDTITITVGSASPVSVVVRDDGTFSVPVKALEEYETVETKEAAAASAVPGALLIKPRPAITCEYGATLPCVQQPYEGDKQVSGKGKAGWNIKLKIDQKDSGASCTVTSDGTFTVPLASALSLGAGAIPIIEVDQSDPSAKMRDSKLRAGGG